MFFWFGSKFVSKFLWHFYKKHVFHVFLIKSWFAVMNLLIFLLPNWKNMFLQLFMCFLHKILIRSHEFTYSFTLKLVKHVFITFCVFFTIKVDSRSWIYSIIYSQTCKMLFFNKKHVFLLKSWFAVMNLLTFLLPNM